MTMGPLEGLAYGFSVALTPGNLFACFVGVLVGTIVGILPGIGPVGAMALLLPSTFALQPATAIIMLAGIYYGAMYGGSTTDLVFFKSASRVSDSTSRSARPCSVSSKNLSSGRRPLLPGPIKIVRGHSAELTPVMLNFVGR